MAMRGFKQFRRSTETLFNRIFEARNYAVASFFIPGNLVSAAVAGGGFVFLKKFGGQTNKYRLQWP
jgi:hypothetical protein